jgi:hypothetical protein
MAMTIAVSSYGGNDPMTILAVGAMLDDGVEIRPCMDIVPVVSAFWR